MMLLGLAALEQAAAQQVPWQTQLQNQQTQVLNRVADPYRDNDPIRNPEFREEYMHADGSINERVLMMLQKYVPMSAGGMPEFVGMIIMFCLVGGLLYGWMQSQKCWEPRDNDNTLRLQESRRQRNLHKMDAQGV
eukprot:CAMPEP_0179452056 /NCGR_PEP_ID=MMETSP0799-20121207/36018_1 /TAXON_ID=46947 /ORGANISM="Geminigera cryophila, Strain CCMP2564" /LENGTH=134 /DNA_ID=CAMNT_0021247749 /DNA_START=27 /DNA_END=431 /DNA_ORIENTATION=+